MRYGLVVCALLAWSAWGEAAEIHVAPAAASPDASYVHTLGEARDAIRAMKQAGGLPEGGVTVWVHAGVYPLAESFRLSREDGGEAGKPIVYRAVAGEEARLVGGVEIAASAFQPVTDAAVLERIDAAARGQVLAADAKAAGVADFGAFPDQFEGAPAISELFFNEQRMTLARWPNEGWATIAKVIESGPAPWRNVASDKPGTFEYEGDRPSRWIHAPAVWLHGYWCFDWSADTIKVAQIDPEKRQIVLGPNHTYGIGGGNSAARRWYAVNLLEELDTPGEYYIDRTEGRLYFWPPQPLEGARIVLSSLKDPVIDIKGADFVTVQGLTVEACAGTGIRVADGRENRVVGCRVRNSGLGGITVEGGEKHLVAACDIYDTGTFGLAMSGGDRKTLTPSGHEAVNNHIYRVSRRQPTHAYHVSIGGVGVRLAHNLLHDGPHQAIGLGGNEHVIEYNDIHHTGMETDDSGSFYMGRNPSERGNIIRYNYWHEIGSTFTHGTCAVYFDDGTGGQTVFGNVFYKAAGGNFGAVFLHGGHDNVVDNNIFIECKKAMGHVPWSDAMWDEWLKGELWQERLLKEVDITSPVYVERYPQLAGYFEGAMKPRLNHASRNVAVRCGSFVDGNWEVRDSFVTTGDPGFVDAEKQDFRLKDDSVVFRSVPGFQRIPFERIGLYVDEDRRVKGEE